jgi:hypothetical protein
MEINMQDEERMNKRVAFCKNLYCPNLTEYPLTQEQCPDCNRMLARGESGTFTPLELTPIDPVIELEAK